MSATDYDGNTWLLLLNPISGGGLGLRDRARVSVLPQALRIITPSPGGP